MLKRIQAGALVLGLGFFAYLVYEIGVDAIIRDLREISWGLGIIVLLELVLDAFNTIGWRYTLPPADRHISFWHLYLVRMAGSAFNQVIPSATMGGEPIKVMLLRPHMRTSNAVASVITAKLAYSAGQALFVLSGFVFAFYRFRLPASLNYAVYAALALTVAGLAAFFWVQHRGLFAVTAAIARALRLPRHLIDRLQQATERIDHQVREIHVDRPADFFISVGWHLAGFGVGMIQMFLFLRWLGLDADIVDALAIESFSVLLQLALFLVPASIGVQEGGKMLIFNGLGLPAATGLTVGIAVRLNQIVGIALGMAAYAYLQRRRPKALPRVEPVPGPAGGSVTPDAQLSSGSQQ
jgi:uncharacterized protein (TIRG00374 family)